MDQDLFKSALNKCIEAERDALGYERWGRWNEWTEERVPYSAFVKTCFGKSKQTKKKIWQVLKRVTDVVTEAEFEQLLRCPAFYRGWCFAQHYLFEEAYHLNGARHKEMEQKLHRLPSLFLKQHPTCAVKSELSPNVIIGVSSQVEVTPLSSGFRLVEIRVVPFDVELHGEFILELNNRLCVVLALGYFDDPYAPAVSYDALSPWVLEKLELRTKRVRDAIEQRYFPICCGLSVDTWCRRFLVASLACQETFSPPFVGNQEKRRRQAKDFLQRICKEENLTSRTAWRAFNKAFGIGAIIRRLDRDGSAGELGPFKWNAGSTLRTIWFELPYDIEIPIFRQNGALYILRTVPDLKKIR